MQCRIRLLPTTTSSTIDVAVAQAQSQPGAAAAPHTPLQLRLSDALPPASHRRLKASLERLQRLTETFSELLLELLPPTANALGAALGVAQHAVMTFTEAEIRAHVVFQVCMYALPRASMWCAHVGCTCVAHAQVLQTQRPTCCMHVCFRRCQC